MFIYNVFKGDNKQPDLAPIKQKMLEEAAKEIPLSVEIEKELDAFAYDTFNNQVLTSFFIAKAPAQYQQLLDLGIRKYPQAFAAIDSLLPVPSLLLESDRCKIEPNKEEGFLSITLTNEFGDEVKGIVPWEGEFSPQALRNEHDHMLHKIDSPLMEILAACQEELNNLDAVSFPTEIPPPLRHQVRAYLEALNKDLDAVNRTYRELNEALTYLDPEEAKNILEAVARIQDERVILPAAALSARLKDIIPELSIPQEELQKLVLSKLKEVNEFLSELQKDKKEFTPLVAKIKALQTTDGKAKEVIERIAKDLVKPEVQTFYSHLGRLQALDPDPNYESLKAAYMSNQAAGRGNNRFFHEGFQEVFPRFVEQAEALHQAAGAAQRDAQEYGFAPSPTLLTSIQSLRGMATRLEEDGGPLHRLVNSLEKTAAEAHEIARLPVPDRRNPKPDFDIALLSPKARNKFTQFEELCQKLDKAPFPRDLEADRERLEEELKKLEEFPALHARAKLLMHRVTLDHKRTFRVADMDLPPYEENDFIRDVKRDGLKINGRTFPANPDVARRIAWELEKQGYGNELKQLLIQNYNQEILKDGEFLGGVMYRGWVATPALTKMPILEGNLLTYEYYSSVSDASNPESAKAAFFYTIVTDLRTKTATVEVVPTYALVIDKYGPKNVPKEAHDLFLAYSKALMEKTDPRPAYQALIQFLEELGGQDELIHYLEMDTDPRFLDLWIKNPGMAKGAMRILKQHPDLSLDSAKKMAELYLRIETQHRFLKEKGQLHPDFEETANSAALFYPIFSPEEQKILRSWMEPGTFLGGITFTENDVGVPSNATFGQEGFILDDGPVSYNMETLRTRFGPAVASDLRGYLSKAIEKEYTDGIYLRKMAMPNFLSLDYRTTPTFFHISTTDTAIVIEKRISDLTVSNRTEILGSYDVDVQIEIPIGSEYTTSRTYSVHPFKRRLEND